MSFNALNLNGTQSCTKKQKRKHVLTFMIFK